MVVYNGFIGRLRETKGSREMYKIYYHKFLEAKKRIQCKNINV